MEYPDDQIVDLLRDNSEEAKEYLYEKYKYIVDIIVNKYKGSAYILSVDMSELKQEALLGFSDALVCYRDDTKASLPTFISLCVERRVRNYIRNEDTYKAKMIREAYSLDYTYDEEGSTLKDIIPDSGFDPSVNVEEQEEMKRIKFEINDTLSDNEREVYELLINGFGYDEIASILKLTSKQVYNYVTRIRTKIKDIL